MKPFTIFPTILFSGIVSVQLPAVAESQKNLTGLSSNIAHVNIDVGRIFGFFAKNRADVSFEFSTQNIYNANGKPRKTEEVEALIHFEDYLKNNMAEMFGFQNLNCTYKLDDINKKFRKKMHDNVGVVEVDYKIACDKDVPGHDFVVNLRELQNVQAIRYTVKTKKMIKGYILGNNGLIAIP